MLSKVTEETHPLVSARSHLGLTVDSRLLSHLFLHQLSVHHISLCCENFVWS